MVFLFWLDDEGQLDNNIIGVFVYQIFIISICLCYNYKLVFFPFLLMIYQQNNTITITVAVSLFEMIIGYGCY